MIIKYNLCYTRTGSSRQNDEFQANFHLNVQAKKIFSRSMKVITDLKLDNNKIVKFIVEAHSLN